MQVDGLKPLFMLRYIRRRPINWIWKEHLFRYPGRMVIGWLYALLLASM